jgi:hypothetical protein
VTSEFIRPHRSNRTGLVAAIEINSTAFFDYFPPASNDAYSRTIIRTIESTNSCRNVKIVEIEIFTIFVTDIPVGQEMLS